jgi:chromosome segregation ATPase
MFVAYPPQRTMVESTIERAMPPIDPAERSRELMAALTSMTAAREELMRRLRDKDAELARVAGRAHAAEASVARLTDDLGRAQRMAGDSAELLSVKQHLLEVQRRERTMQADLEVANGLIASLQTEVHILKGGTSTAAQTQAAQKVEQLQADVVRSQVAAQVEAMTSATNAASPSMRSLISAIGPMLWGLNQSVGYLEQFAANEATLAGHVKQLHLLEKVLKRLVDEAG